MTFHEPEKVVFDNVDLSNCRFLNTDLSKIDFRDVRWDNNPLDRRAVRDEWDGQYEWEEKEKKWVRKKDPEPPDFKRVEQLYCQLRVNYEGKLRYEEAGDFHIGQMEMRRLDPGDNKDKWVEKLARINNFKEKVDEALFLPLGKVLEKLSSSIALIPEILMSDVDKYLLHRFLSPIAFYRWFSKYGTSYWRPLGWLVGLIIVFTLLYLFYGIPSDCGRVDPDWNEAFKFSMDTCFLGPLRSKSEYAPFYFPFYLLALIGSLLGPVLVTLLVLAVRWKFKR